MRPGRWAAGCLLSWLPFLCAGCALVLAAAQPSCETGNTSGGSGNGGSLNADGIPARAAAMYKRQADRWNIDVAFLASIGAQECNHGRCAELNQVNGSGCVGWMQLGVGGACGGYWFQWRCDGNRDGRRDVLEPEDNICASAKGLRRGKGAPPTGGSAARYRAAAGRYYGRCYWQGVAYCDDIMRRAVAYGFPSQRGSRPQSDRRGDTAPERRVGEGTPDGGTSGLGKENDQRPVRPVPASVPVTSGFGPRNSPCAGCSSVHEGLDFGAPAGTPVRAVLDGTVLGARVVSGYGNYLCIRHQPRLQSCYAHLSRFTVRAGDRVKAGHVVARSGNTGSGTGAHLHLEIRRSAAFGADPAVDPQAFLRGAVAPDPGEANTGAQDRCPAPSAT